MFGAALSCTVLCTPVLNFGLIIHWFIADVNLWFVVTRCDPLHLWSTWFHKWALLELNYFDNHRPDWWWCSAHLCCLKTVFIKWHPDQSHGAVHGLVMPAAWVNPARGINTSCEWGGAELQKQHISDTVKAATYCSSSWENKVKADWYMFIWVKPSCVFSPHQCHCDLRRYDECSHFLFPVSVLCSFLTPSPWHSCWLTVSSLFSQFASHLPIHLFPCYLIVINHEKHTEKNISLP